ncbi:unnamed protein product [Soboliphyme baturini]|uniref:Mediator of RNA polymerase II transcription subunit 23 n=1 Tax=Soboliphyme baturini TaxID=241478 RepID=A0A183J940_9BILA|nr:unnamed protein product [Soboliphyme baturini]
MTRNHQVQTTMLPVYFKNVCLSFIPVMDLFIQKLIELPSVCLKFLDTMMNTIGPLFRFHPHPVTMLYTTFRFYEKKLIDSSQVKLKLVYTIHNAFVGVRGESWLLSSDFLQYITQVNDSYDSRIVWLPDMDYFAQLVKRLIDCFATPFQLHASLRKKWWRFSEFPTLQNHILHAICIELMCLPCSPPDIGNSLLNIILKWHPLINRNDIYHWLNCLGLIFSALPVRNFFSYIHQFAHFLSSNILKVSTRRYHQQFVRKT